MPCPGWHGAGLWIRIGLATNASKCEIFLDVQKLPGYLSMVFTCNAKHHGHHLAFTQPIGLHFLNLCRPLFQKLNVVHQGLHATHKA